MAQNFSESQELAEALVGLLFGIMLLGLLLIRAQLGLADQSQAEQTMSLKHPVDP
jgi:hypothetical protein